MTEGIGRYESLADAEWTRDRLAEHGIPATITDMGDTYIHRHRLMVSADNAEQARFLRSWVFPTLA